MSSENATSLNPVALTMGEPAGIGGEIALKAWLNRSEARLPCFCLLDDPERLSSLSDRLGWKVPVIAVSSLSEAGPAFDHALPVLPLRLPAPCKPGLPNGKNAPAVMRSIECGVALVREGQATALVTNPIHKKVLYGAGFAYPGHTEYLAALCGSQCVPVMMLACPGLRVVPVTVHLSLSDAVISLTTEAILHAGRVTATELRDKFGIAEPRLALAGLNPHAGEGGSLGREEIEIIGPAIAALREEGIHAFGPCPADTLFHAGARDSYDVVICMYHDQALIPLKTIDFDGGVNITLGLPIIRTSPDHGTAFDIAGTGKASARSLIAALRSAAEMASVSTR